ncbi:MAG: acetylxylan esterase, partial [Thermoguttaceae bacterium]
EYRSEEMVVQFARILAFRHGFDCTVLFAINPESGLIDPVCRTNIPGVEALQKADAAVFNLRFRDLPEEQMREIDAYLMRGGPVLGIRTSTHAFQIPKDKEFARYSFDYNGPIESWKAGFGRVVLGETWISHHGDHGKEATCGVIALGQENHPLVRGGGRIFGPTDVYTVRLPLPGDSTPIILGVVLSGMRENDASVSGIKNNPMMPIAWTKSYQIEGGKSGKAFASTIGSSQDFESEGLRRLFVNAIYWLTGIEDKIPEKADVDIIGEYETLPMGFGKFKPGLKPSDFIMPADSVPASGTSTDSESATTVKNDLSSTDPATIWNFEELKQVPNAEWGPVLQKNISEKADHQKDGDSDVSILTRKVYFESVPYMGKPTRVMGFYSRPAGIGPFPGMVLVHGGGGTAFSFWTELWAARGYAAIAIDLAGQEAAEEVATEGKQPVVRMTDGGPPQDDVAKFSDFNIEKEEYKDRWTYHSIAALMKAHSLLRSLPEVDASRIGATGISWGGYLTSMLAGIDDRFQVVVP